jgi:preprotein translocase subunit SecE
MASDKEQKTEPETPAIPEGIDPSVAPLAVAEGEAGAGPDENEATALGLRRYVHAAFLAIGVLIAFLGGKLVTLAWNNLADWPAAVRTVPQLVAYDEESRESISMTAGLVIGVVTALRMYRKESIRRFADEVASELSKVTWPNREAVLNGTLVVVIASAIATVYVAILDRFWGFLTTLVYGA